MADKNVKVDPKKVKKRRLEKYVFKCFKQT